ncbi:GH36-type glycosyl hydrolase domain-containing protein [Actinoplanes solisilvae]|uniref:GH36-type glycosyl hydrolase domain-containing protein n=1 Tax=Actinoplanes solisilvae TaxID=2486853 RepID=UPI001F0B81D0|nr:hypothetical protein [Actinoplanes solisilvae]
MVNVWNAYQCFNLSRPASFVESGVGRGMGFRDSNQDLLGFVHMIPERARARILDIAVTQKTTGGAYHQCQTLISGEQRHRRGPQRRPVVAGARRLRVSEGDRRRDDRSTSRCRSTTCPAARPEIATPSVLQAIDQVVASWRASPRGRPRGQAFLLTGLPALTCAGPPQPLCDDSRGAACGPISTYEAGPSSLPSIVVPVEHCEREV